jgi:predicted hydrocarbon binding protein
MKNLENYGVLELNAQEMRETDGGFFITAALVAATLALAVAYVEAVDTFYEAGKEFGKELAEAAIN